MTAAAAGAMPESANGKVSTFSSLGISPGLVRALRMLAISVPTPIQAATIPAILEGRDVIGGAETGSGKTLAFAPVSYTHLTLPTKA